MLALKEETCLQIRDHRQLAQIYKNTSMVLNHHPLSVFSNDKKKEMKKLM